MSHLLAVFYTGYYVVVGNVYKRYRVHYFNPLIK